MTTLIKYAIWPQDSSSSVLNKRSRLCCAGLFNGWGGSVCLHSTGCCAEIENTLAQTHTHTKTLVCVQSDLTVVHHVSLRLCVSKTNCHLLCLEGLSLLIPNPSGLISMPIFLSPFSHISWSFCFSRVSFLHPVIHGYDTTVQARMSWLSLMIWLLWNFPPFKKICRLKSFQTTNMRPVSVSIFSNDYSPDWHQGYLILDAWSAIFLHAHLGLREGWPQQPLWREERRPRQGDTAPLTSSSPAALDWITEQTEFSFHGYEYIFLHRIIFHVVHDQTGKQHKSL